MRACGKVLLLVAWVWLGYRHPHPPEACCYWDFGARQVHRGSSENHSSSRPLFVEDGPTGSLHARALTAQMTNLYGMRAGRKTIHNRLLSHGYYAYRPTRKPLLTASHSRLCLEWEQRWKNLRMANWQHVIFGDASKFQLYLVVGRLRVHRLPGGRSQQRCHTNRVQPGGG